MENEKPKYIITSDCIFEPSQKPHKVCQDYTLCGNDPFPFLIVSDGCSSSENTDIGSRILSHVTKANLDLIFPNSPESTTDFPSEVISSSRNAIRELKINQTCLDATLLVACILKNQLISLMYGDGHIFMTNQKGEIKFHKKISYKNNAPFYLSYRLDENRYNNYKQSQKDIIGTVTISFEGKATDYDLTIEDDEEVGFYSLKNKEFVFITSDGIESFFNYKTGETIPYEEIIKEIISIKSKSGFFIKRRIGRMLKNLAEKDIYNSDDISVAAFLIREEK